MALEKTKLNENLIRSLLRVHYGVEVKSVNKIALGSANCYKISDGEKTYFLKEFQSEYSLCDVEKEVKLTNFLSDKRFTAASFMLTKNNEVGFLHDGSTVCLQEFIAGDTYGYGELPEMLMKPLAGTLGKLHSILKDYSLPRDMDKSWMDDFNVENTVKKYDELLKAVEKNDPRYDSIKADLEYKRESVPRIAALREYFDNITYCATHGDYQGCQCIFENGEVKAVIDFSSAKQLPVVWEIMRSFVQSRYEAEINIDALCEYVREYLKYAPLTESDLIAMPYLYLYQLFRSRYGYTQYLITKTANCDQLIEFAFRRTAICRDIESKAERIAERLAKI